MINTVVTILPDYFYYYYFSLLSSFFLFLTIAATLGRTNKSGKPSRESVFYLDCCCLIISCTFPCAACKGERVTGGVLPHSTHFNFIMQIFPHFVIHPALQSLEMNH